MARTRPIYVPALRLKQGEYRGLAPAPTWRTRSSRVSSSSQGARPGEASLPYQDEIVHETGRRIADHWKMRDAFLDVRFLRRVWEAECASGYLGFRRREAHAQPIPSWVVRCSRVSGSSLSLTHDQGATKAAIRVESGEIDRELGGRLAAVVSARRDAGQCTILADFSDADFSTHCGGRHRASRPRDLQEITAGAWSSRERLPRGEPAETDGDAVIPRNRAGLEGGDLLDGDSPTLGVR